MKPFAKVSEVKEGTILQADNGFTCLHEGEKAVVYRHLLHGLFINCRCGMHCLDGQLSEPTGDVEQSYIGLYLSEQQEETLVE